MMRGVREVKYAVRAESCSWISLPKAENESGNREMLMNSTCSLDTVEMPLGLMLQFQ